MEPRLSTQTAPQTKFCTACGNQIHAMAEICPGCGVRQMAPPPQFVAVPQQMLPTNGKNKVTAGLLGILLGGIGAHKFYMGKVGQGILYLLLCWTFLPAIAGFIEGIIYLTMSDETFAAQVNGGYKSGAFSV